MPRRRRNNRRRFVDDNDENAFPDRDAMPDEDILLEMDDDRQYRSKKHLFNALKAIKKKFKKKYGGTTQDLKTLGDVIKLVNRGYYDQAEDLVDYWRTSMWSEYNNDRLWGRPATKPTKKRTDGVDAVRRVLEDRPPLQFAPMTGQFNNTTRFDAYY